MCTGRWRTNRDELTDSEIVHWYNQRGEDSENRIKELKCDFAGERLPCGQFEANALYFHLCVTAYNLFVLFRHSLPPEWHTRRAPTLRWRPWRRRSARRRCPARRSSARALILDTSPAAGGRSTLPVSPDRPRQPARLCPNPAWERDERA